MWFFDNLCYVRLPYVFHNTIDTCYRNYFNNKEAEGRRKKFNIISSLVDMTRGSERVLDPTCLLTEHRW